MNKFYFTLIGFFFFSPAFSQLEIINTKSESHQLVEGTEVYMVSPPNFINPGLPGFMDPASHAVIMVSKFPDSNFKKFASNFDGLFREDKEVIYQEKVIVNGNQGMFFITEEIREDDPFTNQILFFGSDEFLYMILGICPSDHPGIIESIKDSIFTVVYESNPTESTGKSFFVNVENTKLKEGGEIGGMIFYTADGKIPSESEDKTAFIIGSSLYEVDVENNKNYALKRIKQLPYENIQVSEELLREVKINGLLGFQYDFIGSKEQDKAEELVYVVMLFDDANYYMLLGNAFTDFESNLELFKAISRTFELTNY